MSHKKTQDEFIKQAHEIHGNKYNYDKTHYVSAHVPVCITCPKHGEFWMRPNNHVTKKQGCPLCGNERKGLYQLGNTNDFIQKAKEIHGNKYDYSKVEYKNNHTKVCIICPEHGEFWMKPIDHINGHGCPECARKFGVSEKLVFNELKQFFPDIEYQKKLSFLKSKTSYQTIDFFIPSLNVGIEYQGRQHFAPNVRFGGEEKYNLTYKRDVTKYQKCKENNVKLYYISFEKNLPENYIDTIYTNVNDLIIAIKNNQTIKLTENDISGIIINVLKIIL